VSEFRILLPMTTRLFAGGMCALLANRSGWQVCGEASDGRTAIEKTKELLKPDVVVLDVHMPSLNGMEAARQIRRHNPAQKILWCERFVTSQESDSLRA
jgi:DNA-binding NarL/FixJ family response regulator